MKFARSQSWLRTCTFVTVLLLVSSPSLAAGWGRAKESVRAGAGTVPSVQVSEARLATPTAYPLGVTTDRAGNVWFAEDNADSLAELNQSGSAVRTFSIPTPRHLAWIWFMVFDESGNLWFADESQQLVWRFNPATGAFANFTAGDSFPLALNYDGERSRLWFTSLKTGQVGYFDLTGGEATLEKVVSLAAPLPGPGVSGIAVDPGGDAYVAESFQGRIVELNGTTLSVVRDWVLPPGSQPVGLALDANRGRLWFTDHASSFFGFVDLKTSSHTEYSTSLLLTEGNYEVTLPYWIDVSASGDVWFNEHIANRIARFDPVRLQLTEFDIPTNDSSPLMLAVDDQRGSVWFTEFAGNAVGRILQNSSLAQTVQTSAGAAVLAPSALLTATSEPPAGSAPAFSVTTGATGSPAPGFHVSVQTEGSSYQIQVTAGSADPGNYTGAVCFNLTGGSQCGYVYLTVPGASSDAPLLYAVYVGLGVGVGLLVLAVVRELRRERGRLRTAGR